ncbi:hypothetical protein [Nostoc sp. 106C]|uniref:hypothetical protein n=1 Tax=Nostoc sp. 106C TaxID=1932667 RepID=UPI000B63491A|nr:hypothetical protein [Nostoc sp. 106C]OUL34259.1 hypothetical protein BV375_05005 [Nostoc sp. 106C]
MTNESGLFINEVSFIENAIAFTTNESGLFINEVSFIENAIAFVTNQIGLSINEYLFIENAIAFVTNQIGLFINKYSSIENLDSFVNNVFLLGHRGLAIAKHNKLLAYNALKMITDCKENRDVLCDRHNFKVRCALRHRAILRIASKIRAIRLKIIVRSI